MSKHAQHHFDAFSRRWLDLWTAVPIVVAIRVGRMMTAGPSLSTRDHREFTRMGSEKFDAFGESWLAMVLQWQSECLRLATTPWWLAPDALQQAGNEFGRSLAKVAHQGLEPIERRASANARRLARLRTR